MVFRTILYVHDSYFQSESKDGAEEEPVSLQINYGTAKEVTSCSE